MMNIPSILLLLVCCCSLSLPQSIDITVRGAIGGTAYLSSVSGETITRIDSVVSSDGGRYRFVPHPQKYPPGVYRFTFDKNKWVDFIADGEDVTLATDAATPAESLTVLTSGSNRLFYSFLRLNKAYKTKSELLQLVLARYPKDDPYYASTQSRAVQLQEEYRTFVAVTSQESRSTFAARYIRSARLPLIDFSQPVDKQLGFLKAHALDNIDFGDEGLIHSDLFANKSIEYLMYYRNPQLPKELLEKEFNGAVDSILARARINQNVYTHITSYLIDGFKKFGFEKCIEYILDNYVIKDDICLDEESGSSIQKMIEQKKFLPVGAGAPDIELADTTGREVMLSSVKAGKILLLFYSSACPHCQSMLPKLSALYGSQKQKVFEVVAISLDNNRADWLRFIHENRLEWINLNDPAGWAGMPAIEYYLYATPTMFLLNGDLKIIAKPMTVEEVKGAL